MAILDQGDYEAVRKAIDAKLEEPSMPGSAIEMPIFKGKAIQMVLDKDPDAETRTGTDKDRIKRAAIFYCAALLCPTAIRLTTLSVQTGDMNYSRPAFDADKRAKQLFAMGDAEIDAVLTPTEAAPKRPTIFAKASGRRGR